MQFGKLELRTDSRNGRNRRLCVVECATKNPEALHECHKTKAGAFLPRLSLSPKAWLETHAGTSEGNNEAGDKSHNERNQNLFSHAATVSQIPAANH